MFIEAPHVHVYVLVLISKYRNFEKKHYTKCLHIHVFFHSNMMKDCEFFSTCDTLTCVKIPCVGFAIVTHAFRSKRDTLNEITRISQYKRKSKIAANM